jgi:glycosyltransferase involved in cell wall biosynthesis
VHQAVKVGFYVENKGYPDVDLRFPEQGNPGIGGTEFTEIATAYYIKKFHPDQIDVLLLANITELLPPLLNVHHALDVVDAALKSHEAGCDIFVFRSKLLTHEFIHQLESLNIKVIARSNNTPDVDVVSMIADCSKIKCHVCVGHEQLDIFRDHRIYEKSTRIFDLFNTNNFIPKQDIPKSNNRVVFLGNLIHSKGFHVLARTWPSILAEKPDAQLTVIGSGILYDRSQKLGEWGIAEESYEATYIRPFLADKNGRPIESVHFAGLLGTEKISILQSADVGVVNPTGSTEVCPGSALEILACGTPIVSAAKWGLLDTVVHRKTGLLGKSDKALAQNILELLNNPLLAKQFGKEGIRFLEDNFSPSIIIKQWIELLVDIYNDRPPQPQPMKQNYLYNAKCLREGMRIVKKNVPPLRHLPASIEVLPFLKKNLRPLKSYAVKVLQK